MTLVNTTPAIRGMIADFKVLLDSCVLAVTNQEKDRHVLAAAVNEKLDIIITFNLRDFEIQHLEKWGVKAVSLKV